MNNYYIYTDGFSINVEAASVAEALAKAGLPENVRDAESFEGWLEEGDGYGEIQENGETIAKVSA